MPPKRQRVRKTIDERLSDCHAHLRFLSEARELYPRDPVRYKQIAAELRVLVCKTRSNKALLLDLMDELGFSFSVPPPGPPCGNQPTSLVGDWKDPALKPFQDALARNPLDMEAMHQIGKEMASRRRQLPLREFVDRALAYHCGPHEYSYGDFTVAIAQQFGSSHEDESVDAPLADMKYTFLGGHVSYSAVLIPFCNLILKAGNAFFKYLSDERSESPNVLAMSESNTLRSENRGPEGP